ncbi:MAG TPA: HIT family protein [Phyllobacterium sp.]|nr:HIT family protein [Phyllobacterium sp.]
MMTFELDTKLAADTFSIARLGLCDLRLMNDRRWPWLILVPQRPNICEIHEMTPLDQTMLTFESGIAAQALKAVVDCEKINIAAIGNIVRQLHLHVIARNSGDPAWPGPVWGFGTREPYEEKDAKAFANAILKAI